MKTIEIIQKSENEYLIGMNKMNLTSNNTIHVTAIGEQTEEIATLTKQLHFNRFILVKGKVNYLIDVNRCGKNSPLARETWNELSKHDKTYKVAIFGLHPVAKVIASFVMGFYNKDNQKFFTTEEEAKAWLSV